MIIFTPNTVIRSTEVNSNFDDLDKGKVHNPYKFSAYMGNQQTTTLNTWTKLQMNTEEYDDNNNYSTSTYGYTAPISGIYLFTVMAQLISQSGNPYLVAFSKNGTTEYLRGQEIPNTTGNITLQGTATIKLDANETIYPIYYSGAAGKTLNNLYQHSRFSGILLSV